jgi:hypothetical protein
MPVGPQQVPILVAAIASTNVVGTSTTPNGQFTPGALPQPVIDNIGIQNGQYFLLTDQTNPQQNGLWFADANGPVAIYTFGQGNVNPNETYQSQPGNPGSQNGNQLWGYTAQWRGTGNTPGFQLI